MRRHVPLRPASPSTAMGPAACPTDLESPSLPLPSNQMECQEGQPVTQLPVSQRELLLEQTSIFTMVVLECWEVRVRRSVVPVLCSKPALLADSHTAHDTSSPPAQTSSSSVCLCLLSGTQMCCSAVWPQAEGLIPHIYLYVFHTQREGARV